MPKNATRRKRRTPQEMIKDLEAEIERVKARQARRKLTQSPASKKAISAARALAKAAELAREEGDTALVHAMVDAREALTPLFEERGLQMDKVSRPRGKRPAGVH